MRRRRLSSDQVSVVNTRLSSLLSHGRFGDVSQQCERNTCTDQQSVCCPSSHFVLQKAPEREVLPVYNVAVARFHSSTVLRDEVSGLLGLLQKVGKLVLSASHLAYSEQHLVHLLGGCLCRAESSLGEGISKLQSGSSEHRVEGGL